eukprot:PhM_4_TR13936/c0_g1_i1/m.60512/K10290/FBXO3; F-box protein 3
MMHQVLSRDAIIEVASYLPFQETISGFGTTCRRLHDITHSDKCFEFFYRYYFGERPTLPEHTHHNNNCRFYEHFTSARTSRGISTIHELELFRMFRVDIDEFVCWCNHSDNNIPEIPRTLLPPATVQELQGLAEAGSGSLPVPPELAALYRITAGQTTLDTFSSTNDSLSNLPRHNLEVANFDAARPLEPVLCGMFGGYRLYDHVVNLHFVSIARGTVWRRHVNIDSENNSIPQILCESFMFAESADGSVVYFVVGNNSVYDAQSNQSSGFQTGQVISVNRVGQTILIAESVFAFVHDWVDGLCRNQMNKNKKYSTLRREPQRFVDDCDGSRTTVTRGIAVNVSPLFIPELSMMGRKHFFAYRIRIWVEDATQMPSSQCQLYARHWVITQINSNTNSVSREPEVVDGEGVIGLYPILDASLVGPNKASSSGNKVPFFEYCSCTHFASGGKMKGHFTFVPGLLSGPHLQDTFEVTVPEFECRVPFRL